LGDGGFGQVFLAYDPRLDRDVAIKLLKQASPSERVMQRFFREARAAARLNHANIVAVHDAGYDDGHCWIAYEYINGRPLWWYREHKTPDHATSARLVRSLADALDHAHRRGVLHRDLKPANVLIDEEGNPHLTDFGLSRRADLNSSLTTDGALVGTPAYMSPEQAMGQSKLVDERSDVYSLGIILHELLCGERPQESSFESRYPARARSTSVNQRWVPAGPRSLNKSVPATLDQICRRALALAPSDRYPSARAMARDLDNWLSRRMRSTSRRLPSVPLGGLIGFGMAVLLASVLHLMPAPGSVRTIRDPAPRESSTAGTSPSTSRSTPGRTSGSERVKPVAAFVPLETIGLSNPFVGNQTTRIFHRADSDCARRMAERNRDSLKDAEEARSEGYNPCVKCRPNTMSGSPVNSQDI
jgi:serine/threonine protein kinase